MLCDPFSTDRVWETRENVSCTQNDEFALNPLKMILVDDNGGGGGRG